MAGFFQDLITNAAGTFFGSDYLRDYTHASKTFRTNAYQYAPKFKYLFHVYFDINPEVYSQNVSTGANFGLAVKTVKLPSFTFDTHTLNQYNRKRIVQSKIKYDAVDISFHDDNGNLIRSMWKAYYNYYYADGTKPSVVFAGSRGGAPAQPGATLANYNERTTYVPSITGNESWGYIGDTNVPASVSGVKVPFFKNITVFGFNQHNFVAYTLINPIISRLSHDTYDYAQNSGTMEMQMGVEYETVVYNEGAIDGKTPSNIVTGFGLDANYDRTISPIARPGSNAKILGQGGLVEGVGGAIEAFGRGDILGGIQAAGTTYNTFKNKNLKQIARAEVISGIKNAVQQTPNRNLTVVTPIFGASPTTLGTAGAPVNGQATPQSVGVNPYAGKRNP